MQTRANSVYSVLLTGNGVAAGQTAGRRDFPHFQRPSDDPKALIYPLNSGVGVLHPPRMAQIAVLRYPSPTAPTPTMLATGLPFSMPTPQATSTWLLHSDAYRASQFDIPERYIISFAQASLTASQMSELQLPDLPESGTIAVLVDLEMSGGYGDEENPPRMLLSVSGDGKVVYPMENTWPWLSVEWYPAVEDFLAVEKKGVGVVKEAEKGGELR